MVTLESNPQAESNHLASIERMYSRLIKWIIGIWLTLTVILVTPLLMILDRLPPKHCGWG